MTNTTPTLAERMDRGMDHDPRSVDLFKFIETLDFEQCSDSFGFKSGGDGDNGETLMFLMDCYFAAKDNVPTPSTDDPQWRETWEVSKS